jgi:hypothetical protein
MTIIRIAKPVKYKGVFFPSNVDIPVDDDDVKDLLNRGGWVIKKPIENVEAENSDHKEVNPPESQGGNDGSTGEPHNGEDPNSENGTDNEDDSDDDDDSDDNDDDDSDDEQEKSSETQSPKAVRKKRLRSKR